MNKDINKISLFVGGNICSLRKMKENRTVKEVRGLGDVSEIRVETRYNLKTQKYEI